MSDYKPVNRRWLMDTIGPLWLILALGTVGLFFLIEWVVYDVIDWRRAALVAARKETP